MKSSFELSIDTRMLVERLERAKIGDEISYAELSAVIGREIQTSHYLLVSAMRHVEADGLIFGTIRKIGVKRLADHEIIGIGDAALPRLRRLSKRAVKRLMAVEFAALSQDDKVRHNTLVSGLSLIAHLTKPKQMRKIELQVKTAAAALPLQKTLEAFAK